MRRALQDYVVEDPGRGYGETIHVLDLRIVGCDQAVILCHIAGVPVTSNVRPCLRACLCRLGTHIGSIGLLFSGSLSPGAATLFDSPVALERITVAGVVPPSLHLPVVTFLYHLLKKCETMCMFLNRRESLAPRLPKAALLCLALLTRRALFFFVPFFAGTIAVAVYVRRARYVPLHDRQARR